MEIPGLLHTDGLVLNSELEKDLKVMVRRFEEAFKRRGQKVLRDKGKVI